MKIYFINLNFLQVLWTEKTDLITVYSNALLTFFSMALNVTDRQSVMR